MGGVFANSGGVPAEDCDHPKPVIDRIASNTVVESARGRFLSTPLIEIDFLTIKKHEEPADSICASHAVFAFVFCRLLLELGLLKSE